MKRLSADFAVVGSGVFGAWTALQLRRAGFDTLLLDAWGVGHPRATSAGESRIIRCGYGPQPIYTDWAWESLREWKAFQDEIEVDLFVPSGVLWLGREDDPYLSASREALLRSGIPHRELTPAQLTRHYPALSGEGVGSAILEPEGGALLARQAVRAVARAFVELGGRFEFGEAQPPAASPGRLEGLILSSGTEVRAGAFLFCCGPWLPGLFPTLLDGVIRVTRQEVFFFGTPAGELSYFASSLPVWIEFEQEGHYGVPAIDGRGLKVASDEAGPPCDPSQQERMAGPVELVRVRTYLSRRLPRLAHAPLVETRICQYERTPDNHLILDRHPDWGNVWIIGGGSGHGFKLGPKVGRLASQLALGELAEAPPEVRLSRFLGDRL